MIRTLAAILATSTCIVALATPAAAQTREYNIPAGSLKSALDAYVRQSGRQVVYRADEVRSARSPGVRGQQSADAALAALLVGSGFATRSDGKLVAIVKTLGNVPAAADSSTLLDEESKDGNDLAGATRGDIVVTGSRVRGAPVASPQITIKQDALRDSGHATLAEAVRDLPQNFGGGQNPGIGLSVPESIAADVGGGSSVNLRGLGSDATLTLLNGRRIAYNGALQAVDVSLIPLGAVDRLEIVPDGSSALYGSDAVGGVVNIILKRDFQGIETRARVGGSTGGGNFQQQYALTTGTRWSTGGIIAAVEYNNTSEIEYSDRDYTTERSRGLRLFPALNNRNALLSLHQNVGDDVTLSIDSLYNDRRSEFIYAFDTTGDRAISSMIRASTDRSFALSPAVLIDIGAWQASLQSTYARDKVKYDIDLTAGTVRIPYASVIYENLTKTAEVSANGPLFATPGGSSKLAVGAGYASVSLESFRGTGESGNFSHERSSRFLYGEFVAPIVSPQMNFDGVRQLAITAALRYESYQDAGSVTTPKLGLVFSPNRSFDIKGSWGKSFRAPTLYQRYSPLYVNAYPSTSLGGTNLPAGSSVLYAQGRSENLKPERATTWSVTGDFHPPTVPGLQLSLSYFHVDYEDRIVTPITYIRNALSDNANAAYVTPAPSATQVANLVADADVFSNVTGGNFDPSRVVAIVDNSNVNAGQQSASGIDAILSYEFELNEAATLEVAGNVSYLESNRQLTPQQSSVQLAGLLYNPPRWRGRGTVGWRGDSFRLTAAANYTGTVLDNRTSPSVRLDAQVTFDLTARYVARDSEHGLLRNFSVGLTVQNVFNVAPPLIATSAVYETPYDSTNYRPFGRFVGLEVAKKW